MQQLANAFKGVDVYINDLNNRAVLAQKAVQDTFCSKKFAFPKRL